MTEIVGTPVSMPEGKRQGPCKKGVRRGVNVGFAGHRIQAHHTSENGGKQRGIARSEHEHLLHTTPRNL